MLTQITVRHFVQLHEKYMHVRFVFIFYPFNTKYLHMYSIKVAENAADLQLMLDCLNEWCGRNSMSINVD